MLDEVHFFVEEHMDGRIKFTGASHQIRLELTKMGKMLGLPPGTTSTDPLVVVGDGNFFDVHRRLCRIMDDWDKWDDDAQAHFTSRKHSTPNPYA